MEGIYGWADSVDLGLLEEGCYIMTLIVDNQSGNPKKLT
jgi:hypothetical protein